MEVPLIIWHSVRKYFSTHMQEYKVQDILRVDDSNNNFMVIAQHKGGSWSCWTNWDEVNQKLSGQHDDMPDYNMAVLVCEYLLNEN